VLNSCKLNADSYSVYRRMKGRKRVPTRANRRRLVSASIVLISDEQVKKSSERADDIYERDAMIRGGQSGTIDSKDSTVSDRHFLGT
jgi:hypothetical protein